MVEKSLHLAVKNWYARLDDQLERNVDGFMVDIVRGDLLIEIQTSNFSAIKPKLRKLVENHNLRLVHPIPKNKWIVRLDKDGETILSKRKSPKKGRLEDLFFELVYIPELLRSPKFSLEVLLIDSEEVLINDRRGSWRRRGWSIHDQRLIDVIENFLFDSPENLLCLLPQSLPEKFTTKNLARELNISRRLAQKMVYCLHRMELLKTNGRLNRAILYKR